MREGRLDARDMCGLRRRPAPAEGRWRRRLGQLVAVVTWLGPVPGGGEEVLIVDRATGETVGTLRQPFGDDFYAARLEEDLLTLAPEAFEDEWLSSGRFAPLEPGDPTTPFTGVFAP